jgi:archaetidylinositol phosphate synthase
MGEVGRWTIFTSMPKRVSHSLLDPYLTLPLKSVYSRAGIPASFPPDGIVLVGHLAAIAGAIGFAIADQYWWAGLLAAAGVAGNHTADVLDGTHARATNQCRNGGELLDHFVDPLSFSYWVAGMAYCADCLLLGIGGVIVIYATAVLTNIRAKMIGEFALARFGPTEFKTLLVMFGLAMAGIVGGWWLSPDLGPRVAFWFVLALFVSGLTQLKWSLWKAVRAVNAADAPPDTTEWEIRN